MTDRHLSTALTQLATLMAAITNPRINLIHWHQAGEGPPPPTVQVVRTLTHHLQGGGGAASSSSGPGGHIPRPTGPTDTLPLASGSPPSGVYSSPTGMSSPSGAMNLTPPSGVIHSSPIGMSSGSRPSGAVNFTPPSGALHGSASPDSAGAAGSASAGTLNAPTGELALVSRLFDLLEGREARHREAKQRDAIADLQVKWLSNVQPFDPARHDISSWLESFRKLIPRSVTDEQALTALECRLPTEYGDLLRQAQRECNARSLQGWEECITLFHSRVTGSESRLLRLKRLHRLTQKDGEPIRQYALRMRVELERAHGRKPTEQEWRDQVMLGSHEATSFELDKVANQMPGTPDFWEVIKAVEFWERQNAALLNHKDPTSAIQQPDAKGASVLLGNVKAPGQEPLIICTWCSQRGHLESTCEREPRCAQCFGPHPVRNHDAIMAIWNLQPSHNQPNRDRSNGPPPHQDRGGPWRTERQRSDDSYKRPHPYPRPPMRAISPANATPLGRGRGRIMDRARHPPQMRDRGRGRGDEGTRELKCFRCGGEGHIKQNCPTPPKGKQNRDQGQGAVVQLITPPYPPPTPPMPDGKTNESNDSELRRRVEQLEMQSKPKKDIGGDLAGDALGSVLKQLLEAYSKDKSPSFNPFKSPC